MSPARLRCRRMPRARRPSPPRSAVTSRNMACGPAAPTTRPRNCSARSTKPRARKCRWRCRRASIAPACFAFKRLATGRRARRDQTHIQRRRLDAAGRRRRQLGLTGLTLDGGGIALPDRRGLVHCQGGRDVRIADCDITAAAAMASGWNRSPAKSAATPSARPRIPRSRLSMHWDYSFSQNTIQDASRQRH